jgi:endoglucanase
MVGNALGFLCGVVLFLLLPFTAQAAGDMARSIQLNQIGYLPAAHKLAAAPADAADMFAVKDAAMGKLVFTGRLDAAKTWGATQQSVRIADFSALTTPGRYRLYIDGLPPSDEFVIAVNVYDALAAASVKAYYFNRASTALEPQYAGRYARAAGHPDNAVRVYESAASATRPAGTLISSPKGWYDAGDFNKYIVSSGIATWTLLSAWEAFPQVFATQRLGIPESGNGVPDILNEVWWELSWMQTMQDPDDGGVYHKLTTLQNEGFVMPADARKPRYVMQKSTAAALDFAAVMAKASRIYAGYGTQFPGAAPRMLAAARAAWQWAQNNPRMFYKQPDNVESGAYDDDHMDDEFAWASAELYLATGDDAFYDAFVARKAPANVPTWSDVGALAWMSLASHRDQLTPKASWVSIEHRVDGLAAKIAQGWSMSPYQVAMRQSDFAWGSNAMALNEAMLLMQAYRLNGKRAYLDAAQSQLDYVLGRNPLGRSFVTGFGVRPPLHIHHRASEASGLADPVPGWLVGGPNPVQEDARKCPKRYPSELPALSYMDNACSYASNEVAINWNAPLVYVTAALQTLTPSTLQ